MDELGSGVRKTFKYCGIYTPGTQSEFIEEDIFTTIIPLKAERTEKVSNIYDAVKERLGKELIFMITQYGVSLDKLKNQFKVERATAQRDMKHF